MYRIYIVEDDPGIAEGIKQQAKAWGLEAKSADNFRDIMGEFAAFSPHLVLLDITLPFFNGYHWCSAIRAVSKVPIIFISSAADNMNIVMAMSMGADDFIAKPFDGGVLMAKIQALLRRSYDFAPGMPIIEHRGAMLNTGDNSLSYNGKSIALTKNEYRILLCLMQNRGKVVSRASLRRWSDTLDYYTVWVHQIKTPIASMRLTLQNSDSPESRRLSSDLGRIERYVEMALVYLRLDSESSDYVIREFELDPLIRRSVKKFSGEFITKRLSLELTPTEARVISDEKWLVFVIEQILSNSLKYTREGSVGIYMTEPKTLCIRDTGIGIAPEDLPRVFEKGYTGRNGRDDMRASGLGLYLCRRVCAKLGHGISAVSVPDEGTEIRIDLSSYNLQPN